MVELYNFLGSWQLFPEKGIYEWGDRPLSSIYKIESTEGKKGLSISYNWTSLENGGFTSAYTIEVGDAQPLKDTTLAEEAEVSFVDSLTFEVSFYQENQVVLKVVHALLPNGYLQLVQQGTSPEGTPYTNTEIYHRQLNVLPYSASVSGVAIKATKEGVIRHKALTAMEEQTNMQLDQIRKQVELLALQAQEIHKRKELSLQIYNAKLSFKPEIGQVYYLYEKEQNAHVLSLISPKEWGPSMPYKTYVAAVQLLADHTWKEL